MTHYREHPPIFRVKCGKNCIQRCRTCFYWGNVYYIRVCLRCQSRFSFEHYAANIVTKSTIGEQPSPDPVCCAKCFRTLTAEHRIKLQAGLEELMYWSHTFTTIWEKAVNQQVEHNMDLITSGNWRSPYWPGLNPPSDYTDAGEPIVWYKEHHTEVTLATLYKRGFIKEWLVRRGRLERGFDDELTTLFSRISQACINLGPVTRHSESVKCDRINSDIKRRRVGFTEWWLWPSDFTGVTCPYEPEDGDCAYVTICKYIVRVNHSQCTDECTEDNCLPKIKAANAHLVGNMRHCERCTTDTTGICDDCYGNYLLQNQAHLPSPNNSMCPSCYRYFV